MDRVRFRIQSSLTSFKESTYEKFISNDHTKHLVDSNLFINEDDCSFFEIILTNQTGRNCCFIKILIII
jgi:hypothetical protein